MPRAALLLFLLLLGGRAWGDPQQYYNLYTDTPRVRIVPAIRELDSLQETDEQYRILSWFSNDFVLKGSTFYDSGASEMRMAASRGSVSLLYPDIPQVARLDLAFTRRGLNTVQVTFKEEIEIPTWSESIEFWGHGIGIRHGYRLVYRDEEGQHYTMDFGVGAHYGWKRFAATIPLRLDEQLSHAQRYRRLFITELVILDDHAAGERRSCIHLTNLAVSRIRRTLDNQDDFWVYRPLYAFDQESVRLMQIRAFGYTNLRARAEEAEEPALASADPPIRSLLAVDADYIPQDLHRIVFRFPRELESLDLEVCRKFVVTLRGENRGERAFLLIRNTLNEHFLLQLGELSYQGWQKITIETPPWVVQRTRSAHEKRSIRLVELIIESGNNPFSREGMHFALGRIGVVEDRGSFFIPDLEILWR